MGAIARALVTAALVGAAGALPAAHAAAPPEGRPCKFTATSWDPVTGAGMWAAEVDGGPVVVPGATVTLRCAIHVEDGRHAGAAAASVTSDAGPGVAVVAPQVVSYQDEYGYAVVCSQVVADGTTWYWTDAGWTTDGSGWCPWPGDIGTPPDLPPPLDWVEAYLWCMYYGWYCPVLEYAACDLDSALPDVPGVVEVREDGDVYVLGEWIWDCPPYGPYEP